MARNVTEQRPQEARLQEDGQIVTAAVVEVTNRGQYGVPREVRIRLPDGGLTEVDLTDRSSNAGVRTGSTLRILIDPQDPTTTRPVDAAPLGERWWPSAAPLLAVAAGALVLSLVMYRANESDRPATRASRLRRLARGSQIRTLDRPCVGGATVSA
jgi:hypothetical protein